MFALERAEKILSSAASYIAAHGLASLGDEWDALPAPLYVTDGDGKITYANHACCAFAGFDPARHDCRWSATWKLYTAKGEPLPPELSPTAVSAREQRNIRGVEALAERPDGSRVHFTPYPTLMFGPEGALLGTVNLMIDLTLCAHVRELQNKAQRYRRLAANIDDASVKETLTNLAQECDDEVSRLHARAD